MTPEARSREALLDALAKLLHESGREAVSKGQVYRGRSTESPHDHLLPVLPFCEWEVLPEPAREGRRSQARWLVEHRIAVVGLLLGIES